MFPFSIKYKFPTKFEGDTHYKKVIVGKIDGREVKWVKRNTYEIVSKGFLGIRNPQGNEYSISFKNNQVTIIASNAYLTAMGALAAIVIIGNLLFSYYENEEVEYGALFLIPIALTFFYFFLVFRFIIIWPTIKKIRRKIEEIDGKN